MHGLKFHDIFKQLNPDQKRAVEAIEGPVMVLAGPGTGKTQVLSARIANILLKTDVNPGNVLALTFTEAAAVNMQRRVVGMIGAAGYQVEIGTFHGFCNAVISNYPEYFPLARGSQALSDVERFLLFEQLFNELELDVLKPLGAPDLYHREAARAISTLKRENVTVERLSELVEQAEGDLEEIKTKTARLKAERALSKQRELITLYRAYQQQLSQLGRFDYEDMIALVVQAFEQEPTLLAEYQEKYQYILVDEYQDTNSAQNRIVELLSEYWGAQANIFVVGDPQQSIFRFQGASLENMAWFMQQFPDVTVINLSVGYRCTQPLYDVSFALLQQQSLDAPDRIQALLPSQPLKSLAGPGPQVQVLRVPSTLLEQTLVAEQVRALLDQGVLAADIAILVRTNAEVLALMDTLDVFAIPYRIEEGTNVLDIEIIRQFVQLFQLIIDLRDTQDETRLFEVLCYEWLGVPPVSTMKLVKTASRARMPVLEYLQSGPSGQLGLELAAIQQRLDQIATWATYDFAHTLPETFVAILQESDLLAWIKDQPNRVQLLSALQALFTEVKSLARSQPGAKLADFMTLLQTLRAAQLAIVVHNFGSSEEGVTVLTAHKAKGQEWGHVFVSGLTSNRWGKRSKPALLPLPDGVLATAPTAPDKLAEERRLLYVALTRAKQQVVLSYADSEPQGASSKALLPSQFVTELEGAAQVESRGAAPQESQAEVLEQQLIGPLRRDQFQADERAYLQSLVDKLSLSVTTLNSYLRDPVQFVYDTLLRVPAAKQPHMSFGTAIHRALEALYQPLAQGENSYPDASVIQSVFEHTLQTEALVERDQQRWLARGEVVLSNYYQHLPATPPAVISLEKTIGYRPNFAYLDDIPLTGKIDRIDWVDQSKKQVRVIDYKTGRARSLKDITAQSTTAQKELSQRELSLPESIRGPYKRQLVFYQLLAELARDFPGKVVSTRFEFVQPNQELSGPPVVRDISIDVSEVEELKTLIKAVMTEIRSLAFLEML